MGCGWDRKKKKRPVRDAQPASERGCSKGFGGVAPNKQNDLPANGGRAIFAKWVPLCIACRFPHSLHISKI